MTSERLPDGMSGPAANRAAAPRAMYFVSADADPAMAARLIEPFAKMGLTPTRVHISREDGTGDVMAADLRVEGVDATTAHLVDKMLRRVVGVRSVIAVME